MIAEEINQNAHHSGYSEGSIVNYMDRVVTAILALHDRFVRWPNAEERSRIKYRSRSKSGISGAVGIVDGTPVNFSQRLSINGETFFSRKGVYCINLQLICDDNGMIRNYLTGWPGSVFDNTLTTRVSRYSFISADDFPSFISAIESSLLVDSNCAFSAFSLA